MWVPETSHPFAALTTAVLATLIVSMLFPFFLSQRSTQSKVQRRYADLSRKKQEEVSALLVTAKEAVFPTMDSERGAPSSRQSFCQRIACSR